MAHATNSKDREDGDSLFDMNMVEWWAQVLVRLTTAMTLDHQAEATAAMHCVLFAMDVGISRVAIETDVGPQDHRLRRVKRSPVLPSTH